jgi:hypothetical protein
VADPLLTRKPNNDEIDAKLKRYKVDPTKSKFHTVDPANLNWMIEQCIKDGHFVVRPRKMRYDYGLRTVVGQAYWNTTDSPITRDYFWEQKVVTTKSFSVSATLETTIMGSFKASVTASFGMQWQTEDTQRDTLKDMKIPAHGVGYMYRSPVLRTIEGDFIVPMPAMGWMDNAPAWRWSGTVTGPGVEGNLKPDVVIVGRPMTPQERKRFEQPTGLEPELGFETSPDGIHRGPAVIAAMMAPNTDDDIATIGL